jgi:ubiquinone/menaquinone biosynthesis C-methylase UbiE
MKRMPHESRFYKPKREVRHSYDLLSGWYDFIAGDSEQTFVNRGLHKLNVVKGESVLEIGCGTGKAITEIAFNGGIYGLDISYGMLKVAQKRTHRGAVLPVFLGQADACFLPFKDNSFDAVFMTFVLELFEFVDIQAVMEECGRVLKPWGRICIVSLSTDKSEYLPQKIYQWFHLRFPRLVDCRPISVQPFLSDAGFTMINSSRYWMWGLPVDICLAYKPVEENYGNRDNA